MQNKNEYTYSKILQYVIEGLLEHNQNTIYIGSKSYSLEDRKEPIEEYCKKIERKIMNLDSLHHEVVAIHPNIIETNDGLEIDGIKEYSEYIPEEEILSTNVENIFIINKQGFVEPKNTNTTSLDRYLRECGMYYNTNMRLVSKLENYILYLYNNKYYVVGYIKINNNKQLEFFRNELNNIYDMVIYCKSCEFDNTDRAGYTAELFKTNFYYLSKGDIDGYKRNYEMSVYYINTWFQHQKGEK